MVGGGGVPAFGGDRGGIFCGDPDNLSDNLEGGVADGGT